MSRFNIYAVYIDPRNGSLTEDDDCFIGWDEGMQTYFFQSGYVINHETDQPLIWIGTSPKEHEDFDDFLHAISGILKSPDIPDLFEKLESKQED